MSRTGMYNSQLAIGRRRNEALIRTGKTFYDTYKESSEITDIYQLVRGLPVQAPSYFIFNNDFLNRLYQGI